MASCLFLLHMTQFYHILPHLSIEKRKLIPKNNINFPFISLFNCAIILRTTNGRPYRYLFSRRDVNVNRLFGGSKPPPYDTMMFFSRRGVKLNYLYDGRIWNLPLRHIQLCILHSAIDYESHIRMKKTAENSAVFNLKEIKY